MMVTATLAGGSLFGACETRLKEALVGGAKDYLFALLDPNTIVDMLYPETDDTTGDSAAD
jgi:hypothetical protein